MTRDPVRSLVESPRNSVTEDVLGEGKQRFRRMCRELERLPFWAEAGGARVLWKHQREAIQLCLAYLAVAPHERHPDGWREAALVKMPTGTGKSGVIAVLARCLSTVSRVVVLTPRTALVEQMIDDVRDRFWRRLGYGYPKGIRREAIDREPLRRADSLRAGGGAAPNIDPVTVRRLLPSNVSELRELIAKDHRAVLIGTFTALGMISSWRRRPELPDDDVDTRAVRERSVGLLAAIADAVQLVIVDEGHYEPAPEWGRSVRALGLPTILFSATPFRNDYKSFTVKGHFVYNYSVREAEEDRIIRRIEAVSPPDVAGPLKTEDAKRRREHDVNRFLDVLEPLYREHVRSVDFPDDGPAKVIIHGEPFADLLVLQSAVQSRLHEPALLIHDQIGAPDSAHRRYHSVREAKAQTENSGNVRIWIHDSKLLEGIDDPSFVAVALYSKFGNARELVQQMGRVIRSTDPARQSEERAFFTAMPEQQATVLRMWERYRDWEEYGKSNPELIVKREVDFPGLVLAQMPEFQYVEGEFRRRFAKDGEVKTAELRIGPTAVVFRERDSAMPEAQLAEELVELMMEEDRFEIRPLEDAPPGCLVFTYFQWRTSPLLEPTYYPEWTLGVAVFVRVEDLVFVQDSGGILVDEERFGLKRVPREELLRAFPSTRGDRPARVTRMSFLSLDLSARAIRAQVTRVRKFEDTFTDLADPVLVPTSAFGFVGGRGRYVGLNRARISEAHRERMTVGEFRHWVGEIAAFLGDESGGISPVFRRYADAVAAPEDENEALPKNILLDLDDTLEGFVFDSDAATESGLVLAQPMEHDDLCKDVSPGGGFQIRLNCVEGATTKTLRLKATVTYQPGRGRYKLVSEALDKAFPPATPPGSRRQLTVTGLLNREQAFRIITKGGLIFAHQYFFRRRLPHAGRDGESPLLATVNGYAPLAGAYFEQGTEVAQQPATWRRQSVFGLIYDICEQPIAHQDTEADAPADFASLLREYELVICDDGGEEIADFVCVDRSRRRVLLIHAKASRNAEPNGITILEKIGRQALASLAFVSSAPWESKVQAERWQETMTIGEASFPRIWRRPTGDADIKELTSEALGSLSYSREIWIVLGNILDRQLIGRELDRKPLQNWALQLAFYLQSMITACGRANTALRIFCPPSLPSGVRTTGRRKRGPRGVINLGAGTLEESP